MNVFKVNLSKMLPPQSACQQAGELPDVSAVMTQQLNQQLALLFDAKMLPDAQLWRPVTQLQYRSIASELA